MNSDTNEYEMEEPKTVYFVMDGKMMGGWIIASMSIDFEGDAKHYINHFFPESEKRYQNGCIWRYVERPGKYHLVSGMRMVHDEDVFDTKEEAANAYRDFLLNN